MLLKLRDLFDEISVHETLCVKHIITYILYFYILGLWWNVEL